jgi:hypothetical protein
VGYGSRGIVSHDVLSIAAVATVAVIAGNLAGDRIRPLLDARRTMLLEHWTLAVCGVLALLGFAQ